MRILEGLLTINGIDPYTAYGAFLSEDRPGDMKNYSSLMRPSAVKKIKAVSFPEQDGEKLPNRLVRSWEGRDVSLQFALIAPNATVYMQHYGEFVQMLKQGINGWLDFYFREMNKHFHMYYLDSDGCKQLTDFEGEVAGKFNVKFREPNPQF